MKQFKFPTHPWQSKKLVAASSMCCLMVPIIDFSSSTMKPANKPYFKRKIEKRGWGGSTKQRRGCRGRQIKEKASIWLWNLHIGEITGGSVDGRWGWNCSCWICEQYLPAYLFFVLFFSCMRLKPYCPHVSLELCTHKAHLLCFTLVQISVPGLSSITLLSRYTVKLLII